MTDAIRDRVPKCRWCECDILASIAQTGTAVFDRFWEVLTDEAYCSVECAQMDDVEVENA